MGSARQRDDGIVPVDQDRLQLVILSRTMKQKPRIDRPGPQRLDLQLRYKHGDTDIDVRALLADRAEKSGQIGLPGGDLIQSDADRPDMALADATHPVLRPSEIGEDAAHIFQKGPAGFGETRSPGQTLKQTDTQKLFQCATLP